MYLQDTDVEILVNGKPVKKYSHKGQTYIQANKGSAYSIRVKNHSSNRRLFVVSVDGINVLDGKAAGGDKAGYVINGYCAYDVAGFRTSNEEVHPFKFNDKQKSYAAKSDETNGDVSNCGVIGVRVYEEKVKIPQVLTNTIIIRERVSPTPWETPWETPWNPTYPTWICDSSNITNGTSLDSGGVRGRAADYGTSASNMSDGMLCRCNMMASAEPEATVTQDMAFDAGTEFSKEAITDKVVDTEFDIGRLLVSIEIFYAYRSGLLALGIPIIKEAAITLPKAFPRSFCKPPRD
jgi:hypothetical protein